MRCPKCGFISFDQLASCKKCRKNISEASAELEGAVYEVPTPEFLHFEPGGILADALEEDDDFAFSEDVEDAEAMVDLSGEEHDQEPGKEITIDLEGESDVTAMEIDKESDREDTLELDDAQAVAQSEEMTFDMEGEAEAEESEGEGLQLDFSDIDTSDLGPPGGYVDEESGESLTLGEEDVQTGTAKAGAAVAVGSGLEDLQVDDLDLEGPAPLVTGSKVGGKLMPAMKTGTALDNFDIDLGDLTSEQR